MKLSSVLSKTHSKGVRIDFCGVIVIVLSLMIIVECKAIELESDRVVAIINGSKFHASDIERARKQLSPQAQKLSKVVVDKLLLDNLINTHLVALAARRAGLDKNDKFVDQIRRIEDQILNKSYLDRKIVAFVSKEKLKQRYQSYLKSNSANVEIRARHILVQTKEQAVEVVGRLEKGESFAALARRISTGPSGKQGGDLGYFTRERMVAAFSVAAFATPVGQFTANPVKTQFGWHIIKVEDKRSLRPKSFDQIKAELRTKMAKELVDSVIKKLRKAADIKTFGSDGK